MENFPTPTFALPELVRPPKGQMVLFAGLITPGSAAALHRIRCGYRTPSRRPSASPRGCKCQDGAFLEGKETRRAIAFGKNKKRSCFARIKSRKISEEKKGGKK
jgi:hypothetical protein